ncbi:MAG: TonB-dependent receptor [Chromatiales bacterium]|nr:TonB-dependent receptor [Chromatiales bacterium]
MLNRKLSAIVLGVGAVGLTIGTGVCRGDNDQPLVLNTYEVTGSHIPRAETAGLVPLASYSRADIERSGARTISEFFRDSVFNAAGTVDEQFTQGFAPNSASINLRGLGVNRTLVLLDGRRLPIYPFAENGFESFVDINAIPLAAIERIEVLKDGASAVYGADAVAGVVNLITRKNMEGFDGAVHGGISGEGDGEEGRLSAVFGRRWEGTNATVGFDFLKRQEVMARDRDITASANGPIDDRSLLGRPGTIIPLSSGLPQADSRCPADRLISQGPATFCGYDFAPAVTLIPETQRIGLFGSLEHELSEDWTLFARAFFNQVESERDLAPTNNAPDLFFVPGDNPTNPLGEDIVVLYRLEELGVRRDEFTTRAYQFVGGLNGYLGEWEWEFAGGYGRVDAETRGVNGYAAAADLQDAVFDGSLNLFGDSRTFDADSVSYTTRRDGRSEIWFADAKVNGTAFQWDGKAVLMAAGLELRREEFYDRFDDRTAAGEILGIGGTSAEGDRDLQSAYVEFSVPFTDTLEFQLAGRFDHYSDFGNTFNPKLGVRWQAMDNLVLRASTGTGFKAPALHELYSGEIQSFDSVVDSGVLVSDVEVTSTGNEDLEAEESRSVNLGLVWDLTSAWNIGLGAWYIKNENAVVNDPQNVINNEASLPGLVTRNDAGDVVAIRSPFLNVAGQKLWGIDFDSGVKWNNEGVGDFRLGLTVSYLGSFKEESIEGSGFEERAGEDGRPHVRGRAELAWERGHYGASVGLNYVGGYDRPEADDSIDSWTTVDTQFNWMPSGLPGGTVSVGILNVFDEEPPEDPFLEGWPFINRALHNARGRFFYLNFRYAYDE